MSATPKRLRSDQYGQYLLSEKWRYLRMRVVWRDKAMCRVCGSRKGLEVHHKTYFRLGNERLEDLVTLCSVCHKKLHAKG